MTVEATTAAVDPGAQPASAHAAATVALPEDDLVEVHDERMFRSAALGVPGGRPATGRGRTARRSRAAAARAPTPAQAARRWEARHRHAGA
jgi:hypothetical protein